MMAFRRPVASQEPPRVSAELAGHWAGPIMVGGHSKGGNLAVYAAANAPAAVQERLIAVFCHDGPGFDADFFDTPGYARVAPLVDKSVPGSSIVRHAVRDARACGGRLYDRLQRRRQHHAAFRIALASRSWPIRTG